MRCTEFARRRGGTVRLGGGLCNHESTLIMPDPRSIPSPRTFAPDTVYRPGADDVVGACGVSAKTAVRCALPRSGGRRCRRGDRRQEPGGSMTLRSPLLALGAFALAACADPVAPRQAMMPNVPDGPSLAVT